MGTHPRRTQGAATESSRPVWPLRRLPNAQRAIGRIRDGRIRDTQTLPELPPGSRAKSVCSAAVTRVSTAASSAIWTLVALLSLTGCTTPDVTERPPPPPPSTPITSPSPPEAPPAPIDLDRLDELLTLGDEALREDRLLTPVDRSAYDYYSQALDVAPDHPAALAGLNKLVDRYLGLAAEAAQRGRYDRARNLLERARFVNAKHEGIALAEAQIDLFEGARRETINLDGGALAARSRDLAATLAGLGGKAKAPGAWVTITARSDAEGRWIYQQLRRAPGDTRIRAELVIGGTPSVQIYEFRGGPEG